MSNQATHQTAAALDHKLALSLLESFNAQGALMAWNARLTSITPGACEISLPFSDVVSQQHGYFHGGVIGTIADAAGGYAANTRLMPVSECLTAEYKINIVAPGKGDTLIARGKVLKAGKTLVVSSAEVFVVHEGKEKLCAIMQQTLFVIPKTESKM
ncbi:PaaI family thioesterase [Undibacterium sp. CY18W]|uniref:PaaI family thioesterase n=1 Tax=Undibacterium hunanense TaxID=2762292 RepID=A0ABR6ZWG4_9BURK|nr:PaaI family thioesterase [Undibacterium hunanense]MBC3920170.1 PaaI family thioesterase [Undibacterium hunanense]